MPRVIIYVIFLCMQAMQSCEQAGPLHVDASGNYSYLYDSLATCEKGVAALTGGTPLDHGRFYLDTAKTEWYQCLARHVDTWQQP